MRTEKQVQAIDNVKAAFASFVEARRWLTIGEFEDTVATHMKELGGRGFVVSVGGAIVAAADRKE